MKLTEFDLLTENLNKPPEYQIYEKYKIKLSWDASYYENNLKEGDYFTVTLPDQFKFPASHSANNFDILAPDGVTPVAKAVVSPGPENTPQPLPKSLP